MKQNESMMRTEIREPDAGCCEVESARAKMIISKQASQSALTWIALASFAGVVFLLWLPFDLRRTAIMEWWVANANFDQGGLPIYFSGMGKTRPLEFLPTYLGHVLSPDSFVGGNLLLALLIFARMAIPYAVGRLVERERPALAYVYALLFALYPADSMVFTLRGLGTQFVVVGYLLAVWLLVIYWRRNSITALVGMWLVLGSSLLIAPHALGAMLVTPVVLYRLEGRISRRLVRVAFLWWAVPALAALYILFASYFLPGQSYLEKLWIWHNGLSLYKLKTLIMSVGLVYIRHFFTAWTAAVTSLFVSLWYTLLGVVAAILVTATTRKHLSAHPAPRPLEMGTRPSRLGILIGVIVTFAGFLPFWPTSYRLADWRVYYLSPLGAAVVLIILCTWLDRRTQSEGRLFATLSGVLLGLCVVSGLNQARFYQDRSFFEQHLLADIIDQAPRLTGETVIAIVDSSLDTAAELPPELAQGHFFYPAGFVDALRFIYEDYRDLQALVVCSPTALAECTFDREGITVDGRMSFPGVPRVVDDYAAPYAHLAVFSYSESGRLSLMADLPWPSEGYAPYQLIDSTANLPRRVSTLLSKPVRAQMGSH